MEVEDICSGWKVMHNEPAFAMKPLAPLELCFDSGRGSDLPLPPELLTLYGRIGFPLHRGRPYIMSNFVSTIDGVVALDAPGKAIGDVISGSSEHDSAVMGLLRSIADVVIVGAGTLRASPRHIWTAARICPALAPAYDALRRSISNTPTPLNVIVTARGDIDRSMSVFVSGEVQVLIVTTQEGEKKVTHMGMPSWVQVIAPGDRQHLSARDILEAVEMVRPSCRVYLIEGGPHLMGDMFAEGKIDELFLTLAPQVAGRDTSDERMGIVAGRMFPPELLQQGTLVSVKRAASHLFLRYAFQSNS
jgi:riboflavin biosynthesis pyrimidine reductase